MNNEIQIFSGDIAGFLDDAAWRFAVKYGGQQTVEIEDAEIFSNFRRRKLTDLLVERQPFGRLETRNLDINEASRAIAADENSKNIDKVDSSERKRVYVALYQNHVPLMDDRGWISYDSDEKEIEGTETLTDKFRDLEEVRKYLEFSKQSSVEERNHDSANLGLDEFYEILSNHRKRYVVEHLKQYGASDLSSTAEFAAAAETGTPQRLLSSDERKKVLVSLHQHHLPKMDEYNVINYGRNTRKKVEPDENFETVAGYVDEDLRYMESGESTVYTDFFQNSLNRVVNSFKD